MFKLVLISAVLAVATAAPGLVTVNHVHPVAAVPVVAPVHHTATVVRSHHAVVHHTPVVVKSAPVYTTSVVAAPALVAAPVVHARHYTPLVKIQHYPLYRTHPTFTRVHHAHTYGVTYAAHAPVVRVL